MANIEDDFTRQVIDVLEELEEKFNLSNEEFHREDFKKGDENIYIDRDDEVHLYLPRSEEAGCIKCNELSTLLEELRSAKLIDNVECITKSKYIIRIQPVYNEAHSDFYSALEHIESQHNGAFIIEDNNGEERVRCRIVGGFTAFGVMVALEGSYDKYFPPVLHEDVFVEIEFFGGIVEIEKARQLFKSYVFELSSSLSFDIAASPRPEFVPYDEDAPIKTYVEKFRPLLTGNGLSEPLELYIKAINSPSPDIAILYFTKIIEFVSQTVIRITLTEKIRSKLLSSRALDPDAEYIKELGQLYDDNKVYKKDRDAIKIAISTCCDVTELDFVIPQCVSSKWKFQISNNNPDKALQELAYCVASTRNSIAHAKANYEQTGGEAPEEEFEQLSKCLKLCSQQAVRWYAGRHEIQRLW